MKSESEIWDFLDEFLLKYTGVNFALIELDSSEIMEIETEIGVKLPNSVKKWLTFYLNAEKIEEQFTCRDCLEVTWLTEHDALSILLQGEDDYYWAIKRSDLIYPDPPVFGYGLDYDRDETVFFEYCKWATSVSSFALNYILSYFIPIGGGFCCHPEDTAIESKIQLTYDFGEIKLSLRDDILIFTNNNPESWNYQRYKVYFLTKKAANKRLFDIKWLKNNTKKLFIR